MTTQPSRETSILSSHSSRRGFLRGAAVAAAGTASIAALGHIERASAGPGIVWPAPPVNAQKLEPVFDGKFVVERVGGYKGGEPDQWRPLGSMFLENTSANPIKLIKMRVSYSGSGAPTMRETDMNVVLPGFGVQVVTIQEPRMLAFPLATHIRVTCFFENWVMGVAKEYPLAEFKNAEAGDAYDFPCKSGDLAANEYYFHGNQHGLFGNHHAASKTQRYAYDLGARRWTGSKWTEFRAPKYSGEVVDGTKNDHFVCWGKPVYAVADGTIRKGARLAADNPVPGVDDGSAGNFLLIQHEAGDGLTGQFMMYAHFKAGSIPEGLVLSEGGTYEVKVFKGTFLGLIGNSGTSSAPHLHVHLQRGSNFGAEGIPLRFKRSSYRSWSVYAPQTPGFPWNENPTNAAIPNDVLIDAVGPGTPFQINPNLYFQP